jgi:hypothetical protein
MNVLDRIETYEKEDVMIAIQAAIRMSKRFEEDMVVLHDLKVVPLKTNSEPPLEIVRYDGRPQNTGWTIG